MSQNKTLEEQLRSIEGDFEELTNRLAALVDFHSEDPASAAQSEALRSAHSKASRAVQLIRDYRSGSSRD